MTFLKQFQVEEIKEKLVSDALKLGKLYKAKNSEHLHLSVDHSLSEGYFKDGWEPDGKPIKTKTKIKILKSHSKKFEDDIWCQFYNLGYRTLNYDENFILPFSKELEDHKQIDVVAVNEDTIFLIECKSSEKISPARLLKDEFELLSLRIDGFKKALWQIFGKGKKIKYIFATRNLRIPEDSIHIQRLKKTNSFYYNNDTYDYVNSLIKNYKSAAFYQFIGLVYKNELINTEKIEIPAIKGKMGNKEYYMFSLEPITLLKLGFVLHRTRTNESEFPTYQRLLVPLRLKKITNFIDNEGYFPNSIIINFNTKNNKIEFIPNSKLKDSKSKTGILKIPNAYAIAYIIDGQHRVYGYANSKFLKTNTIPVVAFDNLETTEQLQIFMDINENQKAVSASLRTTLEEDLYWNSHRADERMKALRSSIISKLSFSESSSLFNKIEIGADKGLLPSKPFATALSTSGLIPKARGNKYDEASTLYCIYDTNNQDHNEEMLKSQKDIFNFLVSCYSFVEEEYFEMFNRKKSIIISPRGTFAFISLLGSLNKFEIENKILNKESTSLIRFEKLKKYLIYLLDYISNLSIEEEEKQLKTYGAGADKIWFHFFQIIINSKFPNYNPPELIDWKERQNDEIQNEGRKYGINIEKYMKKTVLENIKILFKENWELEINSIKRECTIRAEQEMEKRYKEGLPKEIIPWTEMFNINDYKTIITKYWSKKPIENENNPNFLSFDQLFSIDVGFGFNSKTEKIKWISFFNSYRNLWAHEGTKEKRLNKKEVEFLKKIYDVFYRKAPHSAKSP